MKKKIEYNIDSSRKYGWKPDWFGAKDFEKLRDFIKRFVTEGDDKEGLYIILLKMVKLNLQKCYKILFLLF